MEEVVLVNERDEAVGSMEKIEAHRRGLLHRAFSVFIFNSRGELLLQQRALTKYHSAGLWTNTCCSHPKPNENVLSGAKRRLLEEMGIETELKHKDSFIYKAEFDNGLIEHEFDHIFTGFYENNPVLHKEEAESYKWLSVEETKKEIKISPDKFTFWFKAAMNRFF